MRRFLPNSDGELKVVIVILKIRVMIAEDERLARDELTYLIEQEVDCELCCSVENGQQLLDTYASFSPDVIFVDIHMPYLSGMDAAKVVYIEKARRNLVKPLIVFTTAYDEYALAAFGVEATEYLLKPYDSSRFQEAMARIRRQLQAQMIATTKVPLLETGHFNLKKLLVDGGEKVVMVPVQEILFAVRQERLIEIHTELETVHAKWTLQELEQKLHGYPFFRPHRSYLVNLNYVHEIIPWFNGAYTMVLSDKAQTNIPVSRSSAKELFEILGQ